MPGEPVGNTPKAIVFGTAQPLEWLPPDLGGGGRCQGRADSLSPPSDSGGRQPG